MRTLKIIMLIMALVLVLSVFVACDSGDGDTSNGTDNTSANAGTNKNEPTDTNDKNTNTSTAKPNDQTDSDASTDNEKPSDTDNSTDGEKPTDTPDVPADELVIFENGKYNYKVILPDNPSDLEKKVYNNIRDKLKSITGVMPEFTTDFKPYNDDGSDRAKPAILIGETNFEESKQVYSELKNAECALKPVGNKIVLAFRTDVDATNAYIKLYALLRDSTAERVSISANVDYTKASNEYLNELPNYSWGKSQIVNCDDSTYMLYAEDATKDDFLSYYDAALINGFLPYESRTVGDNLFETLITEDKYIYMYYRAFDKSIRASIGPIKMLGEVDCGSDRYDVYDASLSLIGQVQTTDCGQGYIFVLPDGRLIIQDGGSKYNAKPDYVYEAIKQVAPDPNDIVIAAWIISHPHSDHQSGFTEFANNHAKDEEITLERIIANYVNRDMYQYVRDDGTKESNGALVDRFREIARYSFPKAQFIKAHTGQVFNFTATSSLEVLYTVEDYLPAEKFNYVNSASLVVRVTVDDTSVLLLADTTHASGKILENMFGSHLRSDMVQLAHHGMAPSNASLYKCVQADVLLWPSTYAHAATRYGQYSSVINVALEYAEDVYVSDVTVTTLPLPYTIQNNKKEEMSKLK